MTLTRSCLRAVAAVALAIAGLFPSATLAQVPGEYQVLIPLQSLQMPVTQPVTSTVGQSLISIVAFADGQPCVFAIVASATADVLLRIGGAGQPPSCSLEGANVTFIDGLGRTLATTFTLHKGTRDLLTNFAPVPPGSSPAPPPTVTPVSPPAATGPTLRPPDTGSAGLR